MKHFPYKNLKVWQLAMEIARDVHSITSSFPKQETYGLTAQMRNCSISIASNIAEGSERNTARSFAHFLGIAKGSLSELATQTMLAQNFHYMKQEEFEKLSVKIDELGKMIFSLRAKLFIPTKH